MKSAKISAVTLFLFFLSLIILIAPASATTIANAGSNKTVTAGTLVSLNGSGSHDTRGYKISKYSWIIQSRPSGSTATLSSQTSEYPTFTPDVAGSYVISLKVQNSRGVWSSSATVTITATAVSRPTANAGANQSVTVGGIVTLAGSSSADPYGQPLTYQWSLQSKPSGSTAALTTPTAVKTNLTPDVAGSYAVSLVVKDTSGISSLPATATVTASATPGGQTTAACYGMYWRFPNVGNLQIGNPSNNADIESFRFKAQHSGPVDSLRCYCMVATGSTYSVGNGGIIKCELQTDDGTANHLPSGNVLASFQITPNSNQSNKTANPIFGTLDNGCSFNRLYFNSPATLQAGQLYHIVFTNPSPQNASNWYSIDCINNYVNVTPAQPAYSDTDLAVVTHWNGKWINPDAQYTPIYSLYWTDGYVQGQPYLAQGYKFGDGFPIYGSSHKARQPFIPSNDTTVTAMNTSVQKVGSPTDLQITLQDSSGGTIATGTVPSSNFPTTGTYQIYWGKVNFASPITLRHGTTYYVEVSTSGGSTSNCYHIWSAENGKSYALDSNAADGFKDGAYSGHYGQYMNGSSWQTDYYDMPIYFNTQ